MLLLSTTLKHKFLYFSFFFNFLLVDYEFHALFGSIFGWCTHFSRHYCRYCFLRFIVFGSSHFCEIYQWIFFNKHVKMYDICLDLLRLSVFNTICWNLQIAHSPFSSTIAVFFHVLTSVIVLLDMSLYIWKSYYSVLTMSFWLRINFPFFLY